jgi:sugar/nucleoside kinase (ribokinase family)
LIVAGHVCLDIIPSFRPSAVGLAAMLVPGKLVDVGPATLSTGGAVGNTGLALQRLGLPVRLFGKVGHDAFGRAVLDLVRGHGRTLADGMIVDPAVATSYTVVINPPGVDRMFLHCPGANDSYGAEDVPAAALAGASAFHFGYPPLMRRMYADGGAELARLLERARGEGLTTSLDMALPDPVSPAGRADWPGILAAALPHVDVFVPSLDEVVFMLDRERAAVWRQRAAAGVPLGGATAADLADISRRLIGMGAAMVMIKLGEYGACLHVTDDPGRLRDAGRIAPREVAAWRGRSLHAPSFRVRVAGTTGAGDCTVAGFLAGLHLGLAPEACLRLAVASGSASVEQEDATSGVPPRGALEARMAAGWPRNPCPVPFPKQV